MNRQTYITEVVNQFLSEAGHIADIMKGAAQSKSGYRDFIRSGIPSGHRSGAPVPMPDPTATPWQIIVKWVIHWWNFFKNLIKRLT